ncbi:MAG: hypothetical protein LBH20_06065 [Treponema sp.]|nr:hypothetical protein [Treponema sp.]
MNYAERIRDLRVYFSCKKSNAELEQKLGLYGGYFSHLKKGRIKNSEKLLFALSSKGISTDWFLTGGGPMLKPQKPEEYGTRAQGVSTDNSGKPASLPAGGEDRRNPGITPHDYFAGQAAVVLINAKGVD